MKTFFFVSHSYEFCRVLLLLSYLNQTQRTEQRMKWKKLPFPPLLNRISLHLYTLELAAMIRILLYEHTENPIRIRIIVETKTMRTKRRGNNDDESHNIPKKYPESESQRVNIQPPRHKWHTHRIPRTPKTTAEKNSQLSSAVIEWNEKQKAETCVKRNVKCAQDTGMEWKFLLNLFTYFTRAGIDTTNDQRRRRMKKLYFAAFFVMSQTFFVFVLQSENEPSHLKFKKGTKRRRRRKKSGEMRSENSTHRDDTILFHPHGYACLACNIRYISLKKRDERHRAED